MFKRATLYHVVEDEAKKFVIGPLWGVQRRIAPSGKQMRKGLANTSIARTTLGRQKSQTNGNRPQQRRIDPMLEMP